MAQCAVGTPLWQLLASGTVGRGLGRGGRRLAPGSAPAARRSVGAGRRRRLHIPGRGSAREAARRRRLPGGECAHSLPLTTMPCSAAMAEFEVSSAPRPAVGRPAADPAGQLSDTVWPMCRSPARECVTLRLSASGPVTGALCRFTPGQSVPGQGVCD